MIELQRVFKGYVSQSMAYTQAIDGVDLKFGDTGLVFVLGKSGCGKSTLLNLIGGLDSADVGDIIVDGVSFKDFKAADYDSFRNQYIGFVFQEFNLIEDITVGDNIALSFSLQAKNYGQNEIDQVLDSVGLKGFSKRMPHELSGGQKQRVAIARAIAKNPKLILADEPTGSLDSQTGDEILQLLKELSKDKLVIAVTHDRELAQKYGDRIIELKDGVVISDSLEEFFEQTNNEQSFKRVKSKLNNKVAFKMGVSNFTKKKIRAVATLLVCCLSILVFGITLSFSFYSPEVSMADIIDKRNIQFFSVRQYEDGNKKINSSQQISQSLINYIKDSHKSIKFIKENDAIESKQQLLDMGFEFYSGAMELTDESAYIADGFLEKLYKTYTQIVVDGQKTTLSKSEHSYSFILGKKLIQNPNSQSEIGFVVAGIFKTDYLRFINPSNEEQTPLFNAEKSYLENKFDYPMGNEAFMSNYKLHSNQGQADFNTMRNYFDVKLSSQLNQTVVNQPFSVIANSMVAASIVAVTDTSFYFGGLPKINDDEVFLSLELYNVLFNDSKNMYYYATPDASNPSSFLSSGKYAQNIGSIINLELIETSVDQTLAQINGLKLGGIALNNPLRTTGDYYILVGDKSFAELNRHNAPASSLLINASSLNKKQMESFLKSLRSKNAFVEFQYSDFVYGKEVELVNSLNIMTLLSCILLFVTFFFVISLISFSVFDKKKEIGILRAMGCRSRDLAKIFIIESLIISIIAFLTAVIGSIFIIDFQNNLLTQEFDLGLRLFYFTPLTILSLFGISIILISAATILPILKIAALRPIDAIKIL